MAAAERPPPPTHVLETILYVKDIDKAAAFYRDIIGLGNSTFSNARGINFCFNNHVLLLFKLGLTTEDIHPEDRPHHTIPNHGPSPAILKQLLGNDDKGTGSTEVLKQHFCLAVPTREDVAQWEKYFEEKGVEVLGVMDWERGGRSVYFADPDGHIGEIGSKGIWPVY